MFHFDTVYIDYINQCTPKPGNMTLSLYSQLVSDSVFFLPPPVVFQVKEDNLRSSFLPLSTASACILTCTYVCCVCIGVGDVLYSNFFKIKPLDLGEEAP